MGNSEVLRAARSDERAELYRAVRLIFKVSGGAITFAAIALIVGFLVGFNVGGVVVLWYGGLVLGMWFAAGALTYALIRDGLLRFARWFLTERVAEEPAGRSGDAD